MANTWEIKITGHSANIQNFLDKECSVKEDSSLNIDSFVIDCEYEDYADIDAIFVDDVSIKTNEKESELRGIIGLPFEFFSESRFEDFFEDLCEMYCLNFSLKVDFFNC